MVNIGSVRNSNQEKFNKVVELRKRGLSYGEIRNTVPISKSTLHCWIRLSGLAMTKEHLEIQLKKRVENKRIATESSKIVREKRVEEEVNSFVSQCRKYLSDSLFVAGIVAYESEGGKLTCKFSNSDYRLIQLFIQFIKRYVFPIQKASFNYRIYVHESRTDDLERIKNFWSSKLEISNEDLGLTWKRNVVKKRRLNVDYVGQMMVTVSSKLILKKLQRLSDIIMKEYYGIV